MIDQKTGRRFSPVSGSRRVSKLESWYWTKLRWLSIELDNYLRKKPVWVDGEKRHALVPEGNVWIWEDDRSTFCWIWKRK